MGGIAGFLSSVIESLIRDLEAGTEEGVRIEVERVKEEERKDVAAREGEKKKAIEGGEKVEREEAEKRKQEEEERKEKERGELERGKKREEETAFWTTPGLRPLAEPPILDWEWFTRHYIPSDLRYALLFPHHPGNTARIKDVRGERGVLNEYLKCTQALADDPAADPARREFYRQLCRELETDYEELDREHCVVWALANDLSRFEFVNLDDDGRTTKLEAWIDRGADILYVWGTEVREKYGHLMPCGFVENRLATFEYSHLTLNGNTTMIERQLMLGEDVLAGWPREVQEKYGYLRGLISEEPPATLLASSSTPYTLSADGSLRSKHSENVLDAETL